MEVRVCGVEAENNEKERRVAMDYVGQFCTYMYL